MPTPLYLNGFENRVLAVGGDAVNSIWNSITLIAMTPAMEATIIRGSGARSLKLTVPGGATNSQASMRAVISSSSRVSGRFYFRKSGNPTQTNCYIYSVASASTFLLLTLQTNGSLQMRASGGTSPTSGTASAILNNNQWYLVEFVIDANTTSWVGRLWVDGVQSATDGSVTGAAAGAFVNNDFGKVQAGTNTTAFDMYFDDFILGSATGITDKWGATNGVVAIVPNADGTHSPATPVAGRFKDVAAVDISGSNAAWDNLDSGDLTQTAERISMPGAGATDYLEVAFATATLGASAPLAVQAEVGLNTDGTQAFTASTRARNGAAETVIFTGDWSIAAGTKVYKRVIVPVANQTELDGLTMRLGYCSTQPDTPYWEALMYEVDLGASTGPTTYDETGSLVADTTSSGADVHEYVGAGTLIVDANESAASVFEARVTGALRSNALSSGVSAKDTAPHTGSLIGGSRASGPDTVAYGETGAVVGAALAGGADSRLASETGALLVKALVGGADAPSYAETAALIADTTQSGVDVREAVEAGSLLPDAFLAGVQSKVLGGKSGSLVAQALQSGADAAIFTETGSLLVLTRESGIYSKGGSKAGSLVAQAAMSGSRTRTISETGSLFAKVLDSGADVTVFGESGSLILSTVLSGPSSKEAPGKTGSLVARALSSGVDAEQRNKAGALLGGSLLAGVDAETRAKAGALIASEILAGSDVFTAVEAGALYALSKLDSASSKDKAASGSLFAIVEIAGPAAGSRFVFVYETTAAGRIEQPDHGGISRSGAGRIERDNEGGRIESPQTGRIQRPRDGRIDDA